MQMDRRQILQGAAAAVLGAPVASYAAIGDFPKQAFFGSAPISAPFGDTYGQAGGPVWEKLQDTERGIYERILTNTKTHLDNVEGFISKPSWDEATSELRLEMGETRKAMVRLSDVAESSVCIRCSVSPESSDLPFCSQTWKFYFTNMFEMCVWYGWISQEAKELYAKFKRQVEALDLALGKKDADVAFRLRAAADITYGQWLASVGL
jgi:hypothetical protein